MHLVWRRTTGEGRGENSGVCCAMHHSWSSMPKLAFLYIANSFSQPLVFLNSEFSSAYKNISSSQPLYHHPTKDKPTSS